MLQSDTESRILNECLIRGSWSKPRAHRAGGLTEATAHPSEDVPRRNRAGYRQAADIDQNGRTPSIIDAKATAEATDRPRSGATSLGRTCSAGWDNLLRGVGVEVAR